MNPKNMITQDPTPPSFSTKLSAHLDLALNTNPLYSLSASILTNKPYFHLKMQSYGSMATNMFSAYASMAASLMLFRSIINDMIPEPMKVYFQSTFGKVFKQVFDRFFNRMSSRMTIIVDEQNGFTRNQIYDAAEVYLRTKINPDSDRLKVNKSAKQKTITLSMEKDQEVLDNYKGFELRWQFVLVEPERDNSRFQPERRYFELSFDKRHRNAVVEEYLALVLAKAKEIKDSERAIKLFTRDCPYENDDDEGGNGCGYWGCINLDHPVTFDKLAMDPIRKQEIIDDLDRFLGRKDYYKKVGKAWKRGYLLYGPPGTGKSSLVAAMANYLRFDVYDLELSSMYSNSELRRTLLCTNNRSIIVIEDIDCSSQLHDRDKDGESDSSDSEEPSNTRLTLSGLLNLIDGLWSTCGDERIIIFTTNHKEKLDPALLRPGRMDMHIYMGYCTPEGFDVLAHNYLGIHDHPRLFPEIKGLIREVDITPAEIAEHLMRNDNAELALEGVLVLLKGKKSEMRKEVHNAAAATADKNNTQQGNESVENQSGNKFGGFMKNLTSFKRRKVK